MDTKEGLSASFTTTSSNCGSTSSGCDIEDDVQKTHHGAVGVMCAERAQREQILPLIVSPVDIRNILSSNE